MKTSPLAALVSVAVASASVARADDDLFSVMVAPTGTGPAPITVRDSNIINLADDLIDTTGDFSSFFGVDFRAALTYADVPDAIVFTMSADRQTATLQLLGQPVRTFSAANGSLSDQIEDYLRGDRGGKRDLRRFFDEINRRSLVAVTDGNPLASTARAAQFTFDRFGFRADDPAFEGRGEDGNSEADGFSFRMDSIGGAIRTDAGDGSSFTFAPSFQFRFNERFAVVAAIPVEAHEIEGSSVGFVGFHVAAPIRVLLPSNGSPVLWQITPSLGSLFSASEDFAAGGLLSTAGVTSLLSLGVKDWTFSLVNHVSFYEGEKIKGDDFEWESGVSQGILKNGVQVSWRFADNWFVYASGAYSNFLNDARVDHWWSPEAGIGFRTSGGFAVVGGYEANLASDYETHRARLTLQFGW
ncbi:MAG: hypothetical protein ACKVW3_17050 [Phycisphaerales bacterium]